MTVGLVIMFLICAALLLWVIIGARGWWWCKLPVIAGTLYFAAVVWYSVDSYLGWPSQEYPPSKFQLHWAIVDEPPKGSDDEGGIYLWLSKIRLKEEQTENWRVYVSWLGYEKTGRVPRVHCVPYTRELHKQMQGAQGMLRKGQKVIGEFTPGRQGKFGDGKGKGKGKGGKGDGQGREGGKEGKGGGKGWFGDNWGLGDWKFYELPPPKFPEKNPSN